MKKYIMILTVLLTFTLVGCKQKEDVLIVLTSSGYEPYEMISPNGELTGFDIELMEALALEAGIKIEFLDVNFDGIIASLQSGQYEVAIAGITPTASRDEVIDFSNVYYNSTSGLENYIVFETEDGYTSLSELNGMTIGAQLGTIQAEILQELSITYGFTVELRTQNAQLVEELKLGSIDAFMVESIVADSILEINQSLSKSLVDEQADQLYGNAIAFAEGSEYQEIFNQALETLQENGTLDALIEKWFQ